MLLRLFILSLLCIHSLYSEVEYNVVALEPAGYVPVDNKIFHTTPKDLSRTGFVVGSWAEVSFKEDQECEGFPEHSAIGSFVYHESLGYQNIDIPGATQVTAEKVNIHGVVGGTCFTTEDCFFLYDAVNPSVLYLEPMSTSGVDYDHCSIYAITADGKMLLRNLYALENWEADLHPAAEQKVLKLFDGTIAFNNQGDTITVDEFIPRFGERQFFGSLDPNGRYGIIAQVLSDNGVVAGSAFDSRGRDNGFIWDSEKGLTSFSNLGGDSLNVTAINCLSQVVGAAHNKKEQLRAFFYDEELGLINLGTLKGHNRSEAYAINDHSRVVGISYVYGVDKESAFIWDKEHGMRNLSLLIPREAGWKCLERADQINPEGYIIGKGTYRGKSRGFLLIPKSL